MPRELVSLIQFARQATAPVSDPRQIAYEFGGFRLVPADGQLIRAGKSVALTPKVFDTLVLLVESGGRLVEKVVGPRDWAHPQVVAMFERLLAAPDAEPQTP